MKGNERKIYRAYVLRGCAKVVPTRAQFLYKIPRSTSTFDTVPLALPLVCKAPYRRRKTVFAVPIIASALQGIVLPLQATPQLIIIRGHLCAE